MLLEKEREEAQKKDEEAEKKRVQLRAHAPTTEMSALERKIAQIEGFGDSSQPLDLEIRLFLIRPGQKGKAITFRRDSETFSWIPFLDLVRTVCNITDSFEPLRLYSALTGRLNDVNDLQNEDLVFVALERERQDERIREEIFKLKQAKEKAETERKRREAEAKEKARIEMNAIIAQREATMRSLSEEKRLQIQKIQALEEKTYECEICMDDVLMRDLFTVDTCFHRFCKNCMRFHIESQIESRTFIDNDSVIGVVCPGNGCENVLGVHEVKSCVDGELFDRYDTLLRDSAVMKTEDMKFCTTPDCGNVLVLSPDEPMLVCHSCYYTWCTKCNVVWHGDMSCDEYQKYVIRKKMEQKVQVTDAKTQHWLKTMTKECPKCKSSIEKDGGNQILLPALKMFRMQPHDMHAMQA